MVLDDCFSDFVHLACRYVQTNCGYSVITQCPAAGSALDDQASPAGRRPMMRAMRKPAVQAPRGKFHFAPIFPLPTADGPASTAPCIGDRHERPPQERSPAARANRLRHDALLALQKGDRSAARVGLIRALRIEPFHLKAALRILRTFLPAFMICLFSSSAGRQKTRGTK